MENLEILKNELSAETYAAVEAETKDSKIKLADLSNGNYVDSGKYQAVKEQLSKTQELLNEKTGEYDKLAETAGDNEELKKQLEEAKANYETKITEIQNEASAKLKKEMVKTDIITRFKPKDIADILPFINLDDIKENEDGKLSGIDEQMKPLTENKSYMFNVEDGAGSTGFEHQHSSTSTDAFMQGFES